VVLVVVDVYCVVVVRFHMLCFYRSPIVCTSRIVSEMTCCVEWDAKPYTLTHACTSRNVYQNIPSYCCCEWL